MQLLTLIRVLSYPGCNLNNLNKLPRTPGIYYVTKGNKVLYVGLAGLNQSTIYARWNAKGDWMHGQLPVLLSGAYGNINNIYVRARPVPRDRLRWVEALEIRRLRPPLNKQFPNPADYAPNVSMAGILASIVIGASVACLLLL